MYDNEYIDLLSNVHTNGIDRPSRAGATRSLFGQTIEFRGLPKGIFPLLTTRQMYPGPILGELAAFVRGAETILEFKEWGCNYWDANAAQWKENDGVQPEFHRVGKIYGSKWRNWYGVDQLEMLVAKLKVDPYGRRHILTTWDPAETDQCLPPCHLLNQYYVDTEKNQLHSLVYMRSVDLCLGLPSDMVLYAALLLLVAKETGYLPGKLEFFLADSHIYLNHIPSLEAQYHNEWRDPAIYVLDPHASLFTFRPSDLTFPNYRTDYPKVKYEFNA